MSKTLGSVMPEEFPYPHKPRAQRKAEARERAKTSILLDEQIQTIGRSKREAEAEKKRLWAVAHPVTAGLIPLVDYVPPAWSYHS